MDSSGTRRSPRIRLQVPVFVRAADASGTEFIELTKTLNISATGCLYRLLRTYCGPIRPSSSPFQPRPPPLRV